MENKVLEQFSQWAATYDQEIVPIFGRMAKYGYFQFLTEITHLVEHNPSGNSYILEAGLGTGSISLALLKTYPKCLIEGIDITETMLEQAQKRINDSGEKSRINLKKASVEKIPFSDNTFDAAIFSLGLHHTQVKKSVKELVRVLKDGGRLIIPDFAANPVWETLIGKTIYRIKMFFYELKMGEKAKAERGAILYSISEWKEILEGNGLNDINIEDITHNSNKWFPKILMISAVK